MAWVEGDGELLRERKRRSVRRVVVALALVVVPLVGLAAACALVSGFASDGTVTPHRDALVGTWRSKDGATLTFSADGTFVAANMPAGSKLVDLASADVLPSLPWGSGTWSVRKDGDGRFGGVDMMAVGDSVELETSGDPSHPTLFAFIGDPDNDDEYVFTKF